MRVALAYGRDGLTVDVPNDAVVVRPTRVPTLPDQTGAVLDALRAPLEGPPLGELLRRARTVAVVFPDITRPMPNRTVLPPLLAEIERHGVASERIRLLCATGTHRPATDQDLAELIGPEILERYPVKNHVATDGEHVSVGRVGGADVLLDPAYVDADVRIVTGFVEPHFFAGFSGGWKGVCPGLAALDTVLEAHSPARIADARATWAVLDGNPVHEFVAAAAALVPPEFSIDVTIDDDRRLTGVFAGALPGSHRAACAFVEHTAVQRVPAPFDVVVSTNAGYPLDRNLYQAVKGISAAELIVRPGGTIVIASECVDGVPPHGNFADLLTRAVTPADLTRTDGPSVLDRWQCQVLGRVLSRARVKVISALTDEQVRAAHLEPAADVARAVQDALGETGGGRLCVLPFGPLTIAVPA